MVLLTFGFMVGTSAMALKGIGQEIKHSMIINAGDMSPQTYVRALSKERYMPYHSKEIKEGYMKWVEHNFMVTDDEKYDLSIEFDKYRREVYQNKQNEHIQNYKKAEKEYYKKKQESNRIVRKKVKHYKHDFGFGQSLENKMNKVLENTFIGNEIQKAWVENDAENFLCTNTIFTGGQIKKYYDICWNYIHNNHRDWI